MSDLITVQGVVISAMPVGEYEQKNCTSYKRTGKDFGICKRSPDVLNSSVYGCG